MGKVTGRTPTGLLLLPQNLIKDNLAIKCLRISINITGHRGVIDTRVAIATTRHPDTSTRPQWRAVWMVETMDSHNYGVGWYQR